MASPWWRTDVLVGGLVGAGLVLVAFRLTGWTGGAILSALLAYEGWTLINDYPEDTISETLWRFAKRPMVPWLFGLGTGWGIQAGWVRDPWISLTIGFLSGHFFFQKHEPAVVKEIVAKVEEAKDAAAQVAAATEGR